MKIYLAGVCGQTKSPYRGEIENAFYSYYYMRKDKKNKKITNAKKYHQLVFVDSGAHTFFSEDETLGNAGVHQKKTKMLETPQEYFNKYVVWLKQNYQHYDYFAELDIGDIVGQKLVNEWREVLKKENLYSKCVTVYHPGCMNWKDYIDMLEDSTSKYVALEGDRNNRARLPYLKLIKECYTRGIKVHGFAMTKDSVMSNYPFYSVDSTSWLQTSMYGFVPYFDKNKIKSVAYKDKKLFSNKIGGDWDIKLLDNPNKEEKRFYEHRIGINAYKQAQKYYTKLWRKKGINWS
jgi:hypothetical protein